MYANHNEETLQKHNKPRDRKEHQDGMPFFHKRLTRDLSSNKLFTITTWKQVSN